MRYLQMTKTSDLNHLGLAVKDLEQTTQFFVELLGWTEAGYDATYPRTGVTDGKVRLTLWQIDDTQPTTEFDRKTNVGLHHLALTVTSGTELTRLHDELNKAPNVDIAFAPELMGDGPRQHFMCHEPSGIRIEFVWAGI
jgi:catechol 2,3-dioxygenase-like lactoylglutathione lyase family enzyme